MIRTTAPRLALATLAAGLAIPAAAQDGGELNLYSSRHYDTDERLYSDFTEATGIAINRIEGDADELIARMEAEGANSPADVLLTVDTTRLERAKDAGILQAMESDVLEERIPANLRTRGTSGSASQRARIFFYDEADVSDPPDTYLALADPAYEGMVCHRSSTNVYSRRCSPRSSSTSARTPRATGPRAWSRTSPATRRAATPTSSAASSPASATSRSRTPTTSHARCARRWTASGAEELEGIGWVFPMMTETEGAHVNLSGGGGPANAPNRENAVAFLEYLASDPAQAYFADGNDEYPVVEGVPLSGSVRQLGELEEDTVDLSAVAKNVAAANRIFAEVGWE